MNRFHRVFVVLAALAVTAGLLTRPPLRGDDGPARGKGLFDRATSQRTEMAAAAADIARDFKELANGKSFTMTVGEITGAASLKNSAGRGIRKDLEEELLRAGVTLQDKADFEIKGDFFPVDDDRSGQLAVQVNLQVLDNKNKRKLVKEYQRGIFNPEDKDASVTSLLAASVTLPADADKKTRDQLLKEGVDKPTTAVKNTRISASADSKFALEILVGDKPDNLAVQEPTKNDRNQAFVEIKPNQVYQIRLVNDADFDVGVILTIDGLNLFTFSEAKTDTGESKFSKMIVEAKSTGTIPGWFINTKESALFRVTDLPAKAANPLKTGGEIGSITASFVAAAPSADQLPPDEAKKTRTKAATEAPQNVPRVQKKYETGRYFFGVIRDVVTVRYTR